MDIEYSGEGFRIILGAPPNGDEYILSMGPIHPNLPWYVKRHVINLQIHKKIKDGVYEKILNNYPGSVKLQIDLTDDERTDNKIERSKKFHLFLYDDNLKRLLRKSPSGYSVDFQALEFEFDPGEFPDPNVGIGP